MIFIPSFSLCCHDTDRFLYCPSHVALVETSAMASPTVCMENEVNVIIAGSSCGDPNDDQHLSLCIEGINFVMLVGDYSKHVIINKSLFDSLG